MLKLFRKIRLRLLSENRARQYLLYALGEIILVVIGILIALQLNNWNEARKDRKNEEQVVLNLYEELGENYNYSQDVLKEIDIRLASTMNLMKYTQEVNASISNKTFDSIMVRAFLLNSYTPVKADLERVLGSSQIDLIQSSELQERLSDYKTSIEQTTLYYRYAEDDFKLVILPYFVKNYPLRTLLLQYGLPVGNTPHPKNHNELLTSMEFENILSVILADSGGLLEAIRANLKLIEALKSLIEKEYPEIVSPSSFSVYINKP